MDIKQVREVIEDYNQWKLTSRDTSMESYLLTKQMESLVEAAMRLEIDLKKLQREGFESVELQKVAEALSLSLDDDDDDDDDELEPTA